MKLSIYLNDVRTAFIKGAMEALGDIRFFEHQERVLHEADKYTAKAEETVRMMQQEV